MSESEKLADARATIEEARQAIADSTLLPASFKSTADLALSRILAELNDGTMTVQTALNLTGSLMDVVLVEVSHKAFSNGDHNYAFAAA